MTLQLFHSEFSNILYEENLIFFFISAGVQFMLTKLQRGIFLLYVEPILQENAKIYLGMGGTPL
jgi:hypothetical protein